MEEPKIMFISYRSPSYEEREKYGCLTLLGYTCDSKACESCAFKNCSYRRACIFAKRQSFRFIIVPPSRILAPDAILSVSDFLEYCNELKDSITVADIFVRFEITHDSYWTLMEKELWAMQNHEHKEYNDSYQVSLDLNGTPLSEYYPIESMDNNKHDLYWRLLYYLRPENRHNHAWGRFASSFMLRCHKCGHVTIMSARALKTMTKYNLQLSCPWCNDGRFTFHYEWGPAQPAKVFYDGIPNKEILPLAPDDVINLLLDNSHKTPQKYPLVCVKGEIFTDGIAWPQIIGMVYNSIRCGDSLVIRYRDRVSNIHEKLLWSYR